LKSLPLSERKSRLAKLLRRALIGLNSLSIMPATGTALFRAACKMQLEGIVSKRAESKYRPGPKRCQSWRKTKNKKAVGYFRVRDNLDG
jgi:bifunctional non-homologous end joining protein LigD